MPVNQSNNGKNINSQIFKTEANTEVEKVSQVVLESEKQPDLDSGDRQEELTEIEESIDRDSISSGLKAKIATLIGSAVILPILAIGTATYYFGSEAIDKQIVLARRSNIGTAQTELVRQKNLLTALLIGTGTTALVAGTIAVSGAKRLIEGQPESRSDREVDKSRLDISWQDVLQATVEEVRRDLSCDRVVVYSLDRQEYGVIVAESVAAGYTQAIGRKIDNALETKYLGRHGNDIVKAIDNVEQSNLSSEEREQLKQLKVKANLVTPIVFEGRPLGLLVAHQCNAPRKWQQSEIDLLHRIAQKASLTIENALVSDRLRDLETKTEQESRYTRCFDDTVRHIRQSLEQDKILDISVEEVRRVLKCDRVLVYRLERRQGMVIAESVLADYSRTLNKTIENPCEVEYLDLYRDGKVRVIDDIYQGQLSQTYIEQLETLEVKANLITPVLNEGKLFGLLVAHQCDRPRNWQDYEISWIEQIATQVGFALDNAGILAESATVRERAEIERKWTYYFDDVVRHIRQSGESNDILNVSVQEIHRVLKCDRVVVYSLQQDKYGMAIAESVSAGRSRTLNKTIENLDLYRDGKVRAIDNIYETQLSQGYIEQLKALEVKAILITPIVSEGKLFVLVAHQCDRPRNWQDYEIRWMSSIAIQAGFALDNAILLKKLQHNERSTQLLNDFSSKVSQAANKEVLNTAVEQVRKIIKLDRAVVYQFDPEDPPAIVAESVGSGYPQASLLNDYLTEESTNSFSVEAIADIHKSNLSDRHLKQLELLEVKATITAPIIRDKQLFALLIGHQCQQPRSWSQQETDLFTQLALQTGLVLDRVKLQEELTLTRNSYGDRNYSQLSSPTQTNPTTIVKPTEIEELEQLEPDLYQMLGTLHDLRNSDRQNKLIESTQLPIEEITLEAEEITLDSENNSETAFITGEFVEKSPAVSELISLNRSEEDISELSDRISKQSLFVTESFQKLATIAKQLSEKDKK